MNPSPPVTTQRADARLDTCTGVGPPQSLSGTGGDATGFGTTPGWHDRPMDDDEYRRMAAAGDTHWWYRATRSLLLDVLGTVLPPAGPGTIYLDAAGGSRGDRPLAGRSRADGARRLRAPGAGGRSGEQRRLPDGCAPTSTCSRIEAARSMRSCASRPCATG